MKRTTSRLLRSQRLFRQPYICSRCYSSAFSATASSNEELEKARNHCRDLVRKYDSPAFTLQTFIPPSVQDAYLALRAFNIDTARVADNTSHSAVGSMRMEFWRTTVTKSLAGTPAPEPVAILLAHANEQLQARTQGKSKLSRTWLHRIINTREKHLGNPPYPSLEALETYAEHTYSTLLYLTLSAYPLQSITADHLASHIGKATGIVAVLRGLPLIAFPPPPPTHHTSNSTAGRLSSEPQGAVLLPLNVMAQSGLQEEAVFRQGSAAPGLKDAVFAVATRANDHLITAREMLTNLRKGLDVGHEFEHAQDPEFDEAEQQERKASGPAKQYAEVQRAFGAMMPAVATKMWLERLEKADFDVFHDGLRRSDWKLPWRAYFDFKRQRIA